MNEESPGQSISLHGQGFFDLPFRVMTRSKMKEKQNSRVSCSDNPRPLFCFWVTVPTALSDYIIHDEDNAACCLNVPVISFYGSAFVLMSQINANLDIPGHKICIQEICVWKTPVFALGALASWTPRVFGGSGRAAAWLMLFKDEHCPLLSTRHIAARQIWLEVENQPPL